MATTTRDPKDSNVSAVLHNIMDGLGYGDNVYFNPPNKLKYPCIVYEIAKRTGKYADDIRYNHRKQYTITVITTDPESDIPDKVLNAFEYISHDNRFISDRLCHDVFTHYE